MKLWVRLGIVSILGLSTTYGGWLGHTIYKYSRIDEVQLADVIIVLGSRPQPNGQPTPMLRCRIEHGVELYEQGWAPRMMFSGGVVGNSPILALPGMSSSGALLPNQAEVMAHVAAEMGVPQEVVILEGQSRTTLESVKLTAKIMRERDFRTAIIVSSPFHMARSLRMYRDAGVTVYGSPSGQGQACEKGLNLAWLRTRELMAFGLYHLFGI